MSRVSLFTGSGATAALLVLLCAALVTPATGQRSTAPGAEGERPAGSALAGESGGAIAGGVGVICQLTGGGGCQLPNQMGQGAGGIIGATSDQSADSDGDGAAGPGFAAADNFSPAADGSITEICWWGFYFNFDLGEDCSSGPVDSFSITYYVNVPAVPGPVPGAVHAGPFAVSPSKAQTGNLVGGSMLREFEYTATHPAVAVTGGECYWIEIQNNLDGECVWLWATAPPGDGHAAQDGGDGTYEAVGETNDFDQAWCVNLALGSPGDCVPDVCGDPLNGACNVATPGTPGCDDEACCAAVCAVDGFCCNVEWDQNCVDSAFAGDGTGICEVPICGGVGSGDCFDGNGTPFCDDTCGGDDPCSGCCDLVCGFDPFCCATEWDGICAGEAMDVCVGCGPGDQPANDDCADAIPVTLGTIAVANTCGSQDGPSHGTCNDGFAVGLGLDIWYTYTADFTGLLSVTVTAAAGADWEPQLAMYEGCDCGALEDPPLACSSLPGGDVTIQPLPPLITAVTNGTCYIIRVGGTVDGQVGNGSLTLAPVPEACQSGIGDCLAPHGGTGCQDQTCCGIVCLSDPSCCDTAWDQLCADLAAATCLPMACGPIDTSPATLTEPEACGADVNGGCNLPAPAFTNIANGEIVHGTAWANAGTRDTDWYLLDSAELAAADTNGNSTVDVHYSVQSELPVVSFAIIDTASDCSGDELVVGTNGYGQSCASVQDGVATITLDPASRHVIFAGTGDVGGGAVFEGYACGGAFGNSYLLCVNIVDDGAPAPVGCPPEAACPWDCELVPNGIIGTSDLLALLAQWGTPGACDFDGGNVGTSDLLKLLANWGACP